MSLPTLHQPTHPVAAPAPTTHFAPVAANPTEPALRLREAGVAGPGAQGEGSRGCAVERFGARRLVAEWWFGEEGLHDAVGGHLGYVARS